MNRLQGSIHPVRQSRYCSPVSELAPTQLLPALFQEKPTSDSPFQLNGRLISNEMQLQLRNESRHDVEGAAIEFEYRQ